LWSTLGFVFGFTSGFRDGIGGRCAGGIDGGFGTWDGRGFVRKVGHLEGQVGEGK
jgi:hypothetical protein